MIPVVQPRELRPISTVTRDTDGRIPIPVGMTATLPRQWNPNLETLDPSPDLDPCRRVDDNAATRISDTDGRIPIPVGLTATRPRQSDPGEYHVIHGETSHGGLQITRHRVQKVETGFLQSKVGKTRGSS